MDSFTFNQENCVPLILETRKDANHDLCTKVKEREQEISDYPTMELMGGQEMLEEMEQAGVFNQMCTIQELVATTSIPPRTIIRAQRIEQSYTNTSSPSLNPQYHPHLSPSQQQWNNSNAVLPQAESPEDLFKIDPQNFPEPHLFPLNHLAVPYSPIQPTIARQASPLLSPLSAWTPKMTQIPSLPYAKQFPPTLSISSVSTPILTNSSSPTIRRYASRFEESDDESNKKQHQKAHQECPVIKKRTVPAKRTVNPVFIYTYGKPHFGTFIFLPFVIMVVKMLSQCLA
jgi:hypothetical protein